MSTFKLANRPFKARILSPFPQGLRQRRRAASERQVLFGRDAVDVLRRLRGRRPLQRQHSLREMPRDMRAL